MKNLLAGLIAVFILLSGSLAMSDSQEVSYGGKIYQRIDGGMSWSDAKADAEARGGNLVVITSQAENTIVKNLCQGASAWIGLKKTGTSGNKGIYSWVDGSGLFYKNWKNNNNNRDNGYMYGGNGKWYTYYEFYKFSYVMERNDVPPPDPCTSSSAGSLTCGSVVSGTLENVGDFQVYTIDLSSSPEGLTATLVSSGDLDVAAKVLDEDCNALAHDDDSGSYKNFRLNDIALAPGKSYRVVVTLNGTSGSGDNSFSLSMICDKDGDTPNEGTVISCGSTVSSSLDEAGDVDYYRFNLLGETEVKLFTTYATTPCGSYNNGCTDVVGTLFDSGYSQIASHDDIGGGDNNKNFSILKTLQAGTYYLRVKNYQSDGTGDYVLHMECTGGGVYHSVEFSSNGGGGVTGSLVQAVADGGATSSVIAETSYDSGYEFLNWTEEGGSFTSIDNPLVIDPVTRSMSVTANFVKKTYTLVFTAGANGKIRYSDETAETNSITQNIIHGESARGVRAVPADGFEFVGWSGSQTGTQNPLILGSVSENMNITANFAPKVTVKFMAGDHGSISGTATQVLLLGDDSDSVTAVAETNYHFSGWTGDYEGLENPLVLTDVRSDKTVNANFAIDTFAVLFTAGANGKINGAAGTQNQTVEWDGSSASMTAEPDPGYLFQGWTGDYVGDENTLVITNVSSDMQIVANFYRPVHKITASAGEHGVISPAGNQSVDHGDSISFTVTPDTGYFVEKVLVDGGSVDLEGKTYTFANVIRDHAISVTFSETQPIPGCSSSKSLNYNSVFDVNDFQMSNATVEGTNIKLQTGNASLDVENIVIPFKQEVSITFLYEGAGHKLTDLGYVLAREGKNGTKHFIYTDINDNNGNGIIDKSKDNSANGVSDINGDGVVDTRDNRVSLGEIAGGTEIVFFLKVDNEDKVFYSKTAWNPDTWNVNKSECVGDGPYYKYYRLGKALGSEGSCMIDKGWLSSTALTRLKNVFGFNFMYNTAGVPDDVVRIEVEKGVRFPHVIAGVPGNKPNEWIMGWEDLPGGGDADHNDLVFQVERKTGGVAELKSENALEPTNSGDYFTGVTIQVSDRMPCSGDTDIKYYVSIDNGVTWVEITHWDEVFKADTAGKIVTVTDSEGNAKPVLLDNWSYGSPEYTVRKARVDFADMGYSGDMLVWKAKMSSEEETCAPEILDVKIDASVASNGEFARAEPVIINNMNLAGSYETPDFDWNDKVNRGHLRATRIYAPENPDETNVLPIWDAGAVLKDRDPDTRKIYFPNITVSAVSGETLNNSDGIRLEGDGVKKSFTGKIDRDHPILATTIEIYAGMDADNSVETFRDKHTDVLEGTRGGTGTINRFTGDFTITFNSPPLAGVIIRANYSYYTAAADPLEFKVTDGTPLVTAEILGINDDYVVGEGIVYDFNGDNKFNNIPHNGTGTKDNSDTDWLVQWVRGWKSGTSLPSVKKEWLLGAVDHSVPAVITPPGYTQWYFGSATSSDERNEFDAFRLEHKSRNTVILVGAKDGMLHAFDGGSFRWGDNPATSSIKENRGYFAWEDLSDRVPAPSWCPCTTGCDKTASSCPNYGTGKELWAFIPANLLPRLKNNYLKGEEQAYVDASPAIADVKLGDAWRTVAICAEGNGGDTVFALDITQPEEPKFMWEFADPDLFRSRSSPGIAKVGRITVGGEKKWVAFFVSGKSAKPEQDDGTGDDAQKRYASVYMIDIADGSLLKRIYLDNPDGEEWAVPSGQPALVDADNNGFTDRIYVGTNKGYMYRINIPDDPEALSPTPIDSYVVNLDMSYLDDNVTPAVTKTVTKRNPIYAAPTVVNSSETKKVDGHVTTTYDVKILFGTSDSPYYDENINTDETRYHFFVYSDKGPNGYVPENKTVVDKTELLWFLELPAGERVYASAFAAAGQIYFGTSTGEVEDPCDISNMSDSGSLYVYDIDSGVQKTKLANIGNITTTPVVDDQHLYYRTSRGLKSLGAGKYNNETKMGFIPEIRTLSWREVLE